MVNIDNFDLLSSCIGDLNKNVREYKREYFDLWMSSGTDIPDLGKQYSMDEKREVEKILDDTYRILVRNMSGFPEESRKRDKWTGRLLSALKKPVSDLKSLIDINLETILSSELLTATDHFINDVIGFNSRLEIKNLHQAIRNVWIMNTLQIYLNRPVVHTPSIFAYSMLYPYTDNVNDSASFNDQEKILFNNRLKNWLEGNDPDYSSEYENQVRELVKKISSDFPRDEFPDVHESILLIYNAQIKSLRQQSSNNDLSEKEILEISFEKGGTSVLADGFLVNGDLDQKQQKFCFGFGTFLQIDDDLQDVETDRKNSHKTVYSSKAGRVNLDEDANRLINYINTVLEKNLGNGKPENNALKKLIRNSCNLLILDAIKKNSKYFSAGYVAEMEVYSPVGFSFYRKLEQDLKKEITDKYRDRFSLNFISQILKTIVSGNYSQ
ncbi:MAG: hypothetical protein GY863_19060 [bacterium]|nr:hypothetical protein [bacterium]